MTFMVQFIETMPDELAEIVAATGSPDAGMSNGDPCFVYHGIEIVDGGEA